jgi:hypothetical protein
MYLRTAVSGAGKRDVALLRELVGADAQELDDLWPSGEAVDLAADRPPWMDLEAARAARTARCPSSDDVCSDVGAWALGMAATAR